MQDSQIDFKAPTTIVVALAQDAVRRVRIMQGELRHLRAMLEYRLQNASVGQTVFEAIVGPFGHMKACVDDLLREQQRVHPLAIKLLDACVDIAAKGGHPSGDASRFRVSQNVLLTINSLRAEQAALVHTLGELHARFEQSVKYSIPDHPSPSIRGLRDSSQADRYYTELARWTYRDLIRFVDSNDGGLASSYPFEKAPRVFVTRRYDPDSSFTRYVNGREHADWWNWHWKDMRLPEKAATVKMQLSGLPNRFVSISLPFWLPDCLEIAPVLGHELAHTVLEDIFGHVAADDWILRDRSPLAALFRSNIEALSGWNAGVEESMARTASLEMVADLLALVRYRSAFLYTAASLSLEHPFLSGFAADSAKQSRVVDLLEQIFNSKSPIEVLASVNAARSLADVNAGSFSHAVILLVRLDVLARIAPELELNDPTTQALADEIAQAVDLLLNAFYEPRPATERASYDLLVRRLVVSARKLVAAPARKFWKMNSGSSTGSPINKFVWVDYFLDRQRVSSSVCDAWRSTANLTEGCHVQDVVWRMRWTEAECAARCEPNLAYSVVLHQALMEDYVFRTSTPAHLFNQLSQFGSVRDVPLPSTLSHFAETYPVAREVGVANSIDSGKHFLSVTGPSIEVRDYIMRGESGDSSSKLRNGPFPKWNRIALLGNDFQVPMEKSPKLLPSMVPFFLTLYSTTKGQSKPEPAAFLRCAEQRDDDSAALVLGRYDVVTLVKDDGRDEGHELANPWNRSPSHRRRVVALDSAPSMETTIAMTFVALSSPLAWRIFYVWLRQALAEKISPDGISVGAFLSDGWEQVVVVFAVAKSSCITAVSFDPILTAMEDISAHPVVGRTETLFFERALVLKAPTKSMLSIRFRCRASTGSALDTSALENELFTAKNSAGKDWAQVFCSQTIKFAVCVLAGLTDYEIRTRFPTDNRHNGNAAQAKLALKAAHHLHYALNSCSSVGRLQTQIAFSRLATSPDSPRNLVAE